MARYVCQKNTGGINMIIDDISKDIETSNTTLSLKTNLFKGFMPDNPDNCVVVLDTGGAAPDKDIPTGSPTFQILVRDKNYKTGHDLMQTIVNLFHRRMNETIGTTYYYSIFLLGEAGNIGRDDKGRDEFSVNFICHIRR